MNQDLIGGDLIRMADRVMEALDAKYLIRPIHYEGMQRIVPLELPTMIEAEGGVRVIIKRELFYGIQQGGRIDPKTGRLIKADDTKNVTNDVTKKLTERQRVILEMLPIGDIENVTKKERVNTAMLAARFGVVQHTIKRDMKVLQDLGLVEHVGPSNGGYWKRLK